MSKKSFIAFSLGANVGDKIQNISKAVALMVERLDLSDYRLSNYYSSEPWGEKEQDWFVNIALTAHCDFDQEIILKIIKEIEVEIGRQKRERWKEREIDIDIILYGSTPYKSQNLQIPHPSFLDRAFVLAPLCEIAGTYILPDLNISIETALACCKDKSIVKII